MTVFLTTQYLEEADVLADRIGIIDAGSIVAEGTPSSSRPRSASRRSRSCPPKGADEAGLGRVLTQFGEPCGGTLGTTAVRLRGRAGDLAEVVRALDAEDVQIANLQLHEPTLDDVFLPRPGRSLEGARRA
jgi:ABC-2 type transport system ATP-binding protein